MGPGELTLVCNGEVQNQEDPGRGQLAGSSDGEGAGGHSREKRSAGRRPVGVLPQAQGQGGLKWALWGCLGSRTGESARVL